MAADLVTKVRVAANPISVARSAVLPLQLRSIFVEDEIREVASFLYLMKTRTDGADGPFVADALMVLLAKLGHAFEAAE